MDCDWNSPLGFPLKNRNPVEKNDHHKISTMATTITKDGCTYRMIIDDELDIDYPVLAYSPNNTWVEDEYALVNLYNDPWALDYLMHIFMELYDGPPQFYYYEGGGSIFDIKELYFIGMRGSPLEPKHPVEQFEWYRDARNKAFNDALEYGKKYEEELESRWNNCKQELQRLASAK